MKSFTTQMRVRFGHVDPAGIAYFPRIFDYVHEAFEELWEVHVGVRYDHLLSERRIGFPMVHCEVDFKHPLRFGDRPIVRVTCTKLGRASIALHYLYRIDDTVCVDAHTIVACINLDTMKSIPVPDEFRKRLEAILEPAAPTSDTGEDA